VELNPGKKLQKLHPACIISVLDQMAQVPIELPFGLILWLVFYSQDITKPGFQHCL
jgi:hypothetical protein